MTSPTTATIKRLFAVSGNRCAFPGCTLSLVDAGSGTVLGEICHIAARSPEGPRYDPGQTDEDRHDFDNLVLLCPSHHKIVDENPDAYTVEKLCEIKEQHEANQISGIELSDEAAQRMATRLEIHGSVSGQVAAGSHIVQVGDTFNMSGDFRGAFLNIKSTLANVTQTIGTLPQDYASTKEELQKLVKELNEVLQQIPDDRAEEAEAVAQTAEALVDKAAEEKPNRAMIEITSNGLKQAAQKLADVMPTVLTIATQIVSAVSKFVARR
jgi:ElaB/YqjD/DUF883 family membrane-anchored ribosome-binding protein